MISSDNTQRRAHVKRVCKCAQKPAEKRSFAVTAHTVNPAIVLLRPASGYAQPARSPQVKSASRPIRTEKKETAPRTLTTPRCKVAVIKNGRRLGIHGDLYAAREAARRGVYPPDSFFVRLPDGVVLGKVKAIGEPFRPGMFRMEGRVDPDSHVLAEDFDQ